VADILSEIERTLDPLARQSRDALRFQELDERRRDLEVGLLALDLGRHQAELDTLAGEISDLDHDLEELRVAGVAMEAEEQQARLRLTEREKEMESLRATYEAAREEVLRRESALALLRQKAASAETQRASLTTEIQRLTGKSQELASQRTELDGESQEASAQLRGAEAKLTEAEPELRARDSAVQAARKALEDARRQTSSLQAEQAALREQISSTRQRLTEAEERAKTEETRLQALRQDSRKAEEAKSHAEAELTSARQAIARHEQALAAAVAGQAEAQARQQSADESYKRRENDHLRKTARLRSLEEMHHNLEGAFKGVRAVIQAARAGKLSGRYQVLVDLIEAPDSLKVALEVALGASAQDIITDTDHEAQAAIRWLKQQGAGRATFLPLDLIRSERMRAAEEPGVLGVASDLITFPEEVRPAVESLLGRVLVVEDLPSAIRLVRKGVGASRLVTLEGEVVRPNGSLTGGSREQGSGILSRKLDIDTLTSEVAQEERELDREAVGLGTLAEASAAAGRSREEAQSAVHSAKLSLERHQAALQSLQRDDQRLSRDLAEVERRLTDSRANVQRHRTGLQTLAEREAESASRAESLGSGTEEAEESLAEATRQAEEYRSGQAECRAQAAALRESVSALERQARGLRAQEEETEGLLRRHQAALVELDNTGEAAKLEAEMLAGVESAKDRSGSLEAQVREAGAARGQAQSELGALSQRQKENAEAQSVTTERRHKAELKQTSHQADVEHIGGRLLEEYQLEPEDALPLADQVTSRQSTVIEVNRLKREIAELGVINLGAIEEYARLTEREEFLRTQKADLEQAEATLLKVIDEIDEKTIETFHETFRKVTAAFDHMFQRLFGGGRTQLVLTEPDNLLETGIDIVVQPPGKKLQHLQLLSGGEKALTAVALLFALLEVKPSPFCLLDEVDAALDEANVGRFAQVVKEFSERSQFILITHNKTTMQVADTLCGVTMQEPGVSRVISVKLEDVGDR
jgi:chromosome segregation protein